MTDLRLPAANGSAPGAGDYALAAFEAAREGVLVLDDGGRCIDANRAACELLAVARGALVGRNFDEAAADGIPGAAELAASVDEGRVAGELERTTPDGSTVAIAIDVEPPLESGRRLVMLRDVSASRALEAERSSLGALHDRAQSLVARLNHELRTPLASVLGISALLSDTDLDPRQREYVQGLRVSGESMMSTIEATVDGAELEAGTLVLADEPYDLRALVEEVCSLAALGSSDTDVDVVSYVAPELPALLRGDDRRVRHVLGTLVGNALEFTRVGEVCVSVTADSVEGRPCARIEVADTGVGIGARRQSSIFGATSGPDASAAGGGLPIARQLVTMMGGTIGVQSAPRAGSTFSFTLPLRGEGGASESRSALALAGERVLVVRTAERGRGLLLRTLEGWGATVAAAVDGEQALALLRTAARAGQPFVVVLIDHREGRAAPLDAVALAHTIVADEALRSTRVLLVAAPRCARAVAAAVPEAWVLTKPIGQARLHNELSRTLAGERDEPERAAPAPPPPPPPDGIGRVLVAEDNRVNQLVAVRLLEQRGFAVDVAGDGREAVVMHAHNLYDAIFMDCQMPEVDGYEATREIRRRELGKRHTPIIAMTASTLPADRERALAAGMDDHVAKPVRAPALERVLARALLTRAA